MDEKLKKIVDLDLFASILSSECDFIYTQEPLVTIGNVLSDTEKKHNTDIFISNMDMRREECRIICEKYWGDRTDRIKRNYIARLLKSTNSSKEEINSFGMSMFEYNWINFANKIYLFISRCIYYIERKIGID